MVLLWTTGDCSACGMTGGSVCASGSAVFIWDSWCMWAVSALVTADALDSATSVGQLVHMLGLLVCYHPPKV